MRCVVLEDEKPAQRVLQNYIAQTPFLQLTGVYESGLCVPPAALREAALLFLDVQLPQMNGLQFLHTLDAPPKVIVTTAFSNYAVDAFEQAVVDYLLKPFSFDRFIKAVLRAREQIQNLGAPEDPLFVYADKSFHRMDLQATLYLKSESDYIRIVSSERQLLILDSIKNWGKKLAGRGFVQTHRSYLVNLKHIESLRGNSVRLSNGEELPVGHTFKAQLLENLQI